MKKTFLIFATVMPASAAVFEGVELLNAIKNVYLANEITVA